MPIWFGRETSKLSSASSSYRRMSLHWCQQQSFKSLLTHCGMQFRLHQRQLKKPLSVGLVEPGLWPVAPDELESGGWEAPVRHEAPEKFSWRSVQFDQFVVCSSRCPMESAPLFVAMLCVAVISHWHWQHLHGCSALHGLPHTFILCFNPYPSPFPFFENSSDLHQSQDWPWRQLGGGAVAPISGCFSQ